MKKSDITSMLTRTRQSPVAILIIGINGAKALVKGGWPFLLIVVVKGQDAFGSIWIYALITLLFFIGVSAILQYLRFFFRVEENKLLVEKGILHRSKIDIPFERIQNVSFEEGILHQVFDVVKIKIDTAGSKDQEFAFNALDRNKALALRDFILAKKERETVSSIASTNGPLAEPILQLDFLDLAKVGISQNHFRTLGLVFVFLLGIFQNIEEYFGDELINRVGVFTTDFMSVSYWVLFTYLLLILATVLIGTVIITILKYWNLRFQKTGRGYKIEHGLFNRKEQSTTKKKIQILQWIRNPIKQLFGIYTIKMFLASSTVATKNQTLVIPGAKVGDFDQILNEIFETRSDELFFHLPANQYLMWRRILFFAFLPSIAFLIASYFQDKQIYYAASALFFLLSLGFQYLYVQNRFIEIGLHSIKFHSGVFEKWYKMVEYRKIQGISLSDSPYQRRNHLKTLTIHSAADNLRMPYIDEQSAKKLQDYMLYNVETSKGEWM